MVGMAVAMMGFAGAMAILAVVISTLAVLPANEGAVEATKALVGISLLMMAGIAAMSKAFSGGLGKAVGLIAGVLAMQLIMTTHAPGIIMDKWGDYVTNVSDITDQ